jgi:tape measure domain-containing protein
MTNKIGLQAVLDLSSFNGAVQSYIGSIAKMVGVTAGVGTAAVTATSKIDKSLKGSTQKVDIFGSAWERIKRITSGLFIVGVYRAISNELKELGREAFAAVSQFQNLKIQLQTLAARDFAREFGGTVGEALGKVSKQSEELLQWIRKIAVSTPFSVQTLAQAVAYGQAFGFTVAQSKRLTLATGNFVAGMGLTNQQLERIIYNFGQMLASGRVLGREVRDLANNFVPIKDIVQAIADESGKTFDQIKQDMSDGKISAGLFIETFTELAEKDFAGAMQRMSRTLSGVTQNIHDFIQTLFGLELLGPVMDKVANSLADFLDKAFSPEVIRFFTAIGFALSNAFETVSNSLKQSLLPAIHNLFDTLGFEAPTALNFASAILKVGIVISQVAEFIARGINKLRDFAAFLYGKFGKTFIDLIAKSGEWGQNFIFAFADGMASAVGAIFKVLSGIARSIAGLLRGHSPPKLLPNLDWWGAQAMQSWLEGWTQADFSVFDDIADTVASYIRALSAKIPETDIIPRILGSRVAISELIATIKKTGEVSEKSLEKVFQAAGLASKSIRDYITKMFQLLAVTERVEEISKILDFDVKLNIPQNIFGVMVDSLANLFKAAQQIGGTLGIEVQRFVIALNDVEDSERRLTAAQNELNQATKFYSDKLSDLQSQLTEVTDFADEESRLKEINAAIATGLLTEEEKNRLELEKKKIAIQRNIRATEEERDTVLGGINSRIDAEREFQQLLQDGADRQQAIIQSLIDLQLEAAQEQLDAAKSLIDVQIENNSLLSEQLKLLEQIAKSGGGGDEGGWEFGADFSGLDEDLREQFENMGIELQTAINDLEDRLRARFLLFVWRIMDPFAQMWNLVKPEWESFKESLGTIYGELETDANGFLTKLGGIWEELSTPLVETVTPAIDDLVSALDPLKTAWDGLMKSLEPFIPVLQSATEKFLVLAGSTALAVLTGILAFLSGLFTGLARSFTVFIEGITTAFNILTFVIEGVKTFVTGFGTFIKGIIEGDWKKIFDGLGLMFWGLRDIALGAFFGILNAAITWLGAVGEFVAGFISGVITYFINFAKKIIDSGKGSVVGGMLWGISQAFSTNFTKLITSIGEWLEEMIQKFLSFVLGMLKTAQELMDSFIEGIRGRFKDKDGLIAKIALWIADVVEEARKKMTEWVLLGKALVEGLISGIINSSSLVMTAIKNLIRAAFGVAEAESETDSPSKKYKRLGMNWMKGLALGIEEGTPIVEKTLSEAMAKLNPKANSLFGGIDPRNLENSSIGSNSRYGSINNTQTHIDRSINVEVNPNYKNVQTEASIKNDVWAVLAMVSR